MGSFLNDAVEKLSYSPEVDQRHPFAPSNQKELGDLLGKVSKAGDVDLNDLLKYYQPDEKAYRGVGLFDKDVGKSLSTLNDVLNHSVAAARGGNAGAGLGSQLGAGFEGVKGKREADRQKAVDDVFKLIDVAGAQGKRALEARKLELGSIQDKFNPVTGELVRFQNGKAMGGAPAAGIPSMGASGGMSGSERAVQAASNGFGRSDELGGFANTPAGRMHAYKEGLTEKKEEAKEDRKYLHGLGERAGVNQRNIDSLNLMSSELPNFHQGTGSDLIYNQGKLLANPSAVKAYENFTANANRLVLDIAQTQKGNQSNNDMILISSTKPSASLSEAGNRNIIESMKAIYERENQMFLAANEFMKRGGKASEFQSRWLQYVNAFPLLTTDKNGDLKTNKGNLTNWEDVLFSPDFDVAIEASKPVRGSEEVEMTVESNPYINMSQEERNELRAKLRGE